MKRNCVASVNTARKSMRTCLTTEGSPEMLSGHAAHYRVPRKGTGGIGWWPHALEHLL